MYYSAGFFNALIWVSLGSLAGVFLFQIWAFIKDKTDKKNQHH